MKLYLPQNVYAAAKDRIRWLFDEFEHVSVDFSGGKDSTVTLNLALMIAEEKGRLPLTATFVDQEAEWQATVDYVRQVMADPRIRPQWLQVPIRLFNATSMDDCWLFCWDPKEEHRWMRPREEIAITENVYGTDRFKEMFDAIPAHDYPKSPAVRIAGVRASESPARMKGLTSYATYKGETWGRAQDKRVGHYTMYPLYDWSDSDIWKAIHEHGWAYNRVYDYQFQHGVPLAQMRVSNLHHETAVHVLYYLQEVEHDTWVKLTQRLHGVNSAKHLRSDMFIPKELPPMFQDWTEYRDFLLEKLIVNPEHKRAFLKSFESFDRRFNGTEAEQKLRRSQVAMILVNDFEGTKMTSFQASNGRFSVNGGTKGALKTPEFRHD